MDSIGSSHFRLREPVNGIERLFRSDVNIGGSTIFVAFSNADDDWPFLIENETDYAASVCQVDESEGASKAADTLQIPAHTKEKWAWSSPAAPAKKIQLTINGSKRVLDVMEIGNLPPFQFKVNALW